MDQEKAFQAEGTARAWALRGEPEETKQRARPQSRLPHCRLHPYGELHSRVLRPRQHCKDLWKWVPPHTCSVMSLEQMSKNQISGSKGLLNGRGHFLKPLF